MLAFCYVCVCVFVRVGAFTTLLGTTSAALFWTVIMKIANRESKGCLKDAFLWAVFFFFFLHNCCCCLSLREYFSSSALFTLQNDLMELCAMVVGTCVSNRPHFNTQEIYSFSLFFSVSKAMNNVCMVWNEGACHFFLCFFLSLLLLLFVSL